MASHSLESAVKALAFEIPSARRRYIITALLVFLTFCITPALMQPALKRGLGSFYSDGYLMFLTLGVTCLVLMFTFEWAKSAVNAATRRLRLEGLGEPIVGMGYTILPVRVETVTTTVIDGAEWVILTVSQKVGNSERYFLKATEEALSSIAALKMLQPDDLICLQPGDEREKVNGWRPICSWSYGKVVFDSERRRLRVVSAAAA